MNQPPRPHDRSSSRHPLPSGRAVAGALLVLLALLGLFGAASGVLDQPVRVAVVARSEVVAGQQLNESDFDTVTVDVPDEVGAALFGAPGELHNAVALSPIGRGELVQHSAVRTATAADGVPGSRSLAFSIETERAVGGDLRPGDEVDVLATYGQGATARTEVVLERAIVEAVSGGEEAALAAGRRLTLTVRVHDGAEMLDLANAVEVADVRLVRSTGTTSPLPGAAVVSDEQLRRSEGTEEDFPAGAEGQR